MRGGSTLQAVARHRKVDPFAAPGEADLTAHVDFATLARIAQSRGVQWLGTVDAGRAGCARWGSKPAPKRSPRAPRTTAARSTAARDRLIGDDQMGTLFKVMGLAAAGWPLGVGFDRE